MWTDISVNGHWHQHASAMFTGFNGPFDAEGLGLTGRHHIVEGLWEGRSNGIKHRCLQARARKAGRDEEKLIAGGVAGGSHK
jgi:hypothetical protein